METVKIGIREFRENLAGYLESDKPLAISKEAVDRILRYESALDRQFYKALDQLGRLGSSLSFQVRMILVAHSTKSRPVSCPSGTLLDDSGVFLHNGGI